MDANNILAANVLDIIFEGKNKDYGAYELRKTYNKRVTIAIVITLSGIACLLFAFTIANNYSSKNVIANKGDGNIITRFKIIDPPPPPPPPTPKPPPPPTRTIAYPPPIVTADKLVIKPPTEIKDILESHIDIKTIEGPASAEYTAPPVDIQGSQVTLKPAEKETKEFIRIEREAVFPGGPEAWSKYIQREIEKNIDEFTESDFGTCMIRFIVDKNGKVSQVEATTMKESKLAEIAVNAIRKGPDWIPALQNGIFVTATRTQPVAFKIIN